MKNSTFFIALFLLTVGAFAQKAGVDKIKIEDPKQTSLSPKAFTAEDLMSCKRISDPQISPDGASVMYRLSDPDIEQNKLFSDIFLAPIGGGKSVNITNDPESEFNARFSPDGKKIAYLSSTDEGPQIFLANPDGSDKKQITRMKNGVSGFLWSPDGSKFAFASEVTLEKTTLDKYPDYPKANVRLYDKVPLRHWDEWVDEKYSHVFVIDADGGDPIDLMPGEKFDSPMKPFGGIEQIAWSPDSREIAYTSKKLSGIDFVEQTDSDIYLVDLETMKTRNITDGMNGFDMDPVYSPDGKYIAFMSMERAGFESDRHRIMLFDRETGLKRDLTKDFDYWAGGQIWAPDSKYMYYTAGYQGCYHIFKIDVASGRWEKLTEGNYNWGSGLQISADGNHLVFGREDINRPSELFSFNLATGDLTQITRANGFIDTKTADVVVEEKFIESKDGAKIHTWVIYPPNFNPNEKYPMITYCQGGPQSMISQRFHYRWNFKLLASQGYVVVAPNRRGVPGFGQDWNDAISKDWGGKPMEDILAATDFMKKEDYIDENRLAAMGASAGGYAVFWLAGKHDGRFAAFASHCGVFNFESMYGATEELWFPNWEYGGPYWVKANRDQYEDFSPHKFADKWDTPIIVSTGEYDFRVPYTQSMEAFQVAQVKRIPSEIIVFPEETHFVAKPQNFIVWMTEYFKFLDRYCKP